MMDMQSKESIFDAIRALNDVEHKQTISDVMDVFGPSAYGVFLFILSLIIVIPTGVIPGIAVVCSLLIVLLMLQFSFGLDNIYIPQVISHRTVPKKIIELLERYCSKYEPIITRYVQPNRMRYIFTWPYKLITIILLLFVSISTLPLTLLPIFEIVPGVIMMMYASALIFLDGRTMLWAWASSFVYVSVLALIITTTTYLI